MRLESGLDRLVAETDLAEAGTGSVFEHDAELEIDVRLEADDADPGAEADDAGLGGVGMVAQDVAALLIEWRLAEDGAALVDFDVGDALAFAERPACDLDVVDIAAADARSVDGEGPNLTWLGRP